MVRSKKDKVFIFFFWPLPWKEYTETKCADIFGDSFWLPKGRSEEAKFTPYPSECPFYEGYWLDGLYGAVECKLQGTIPNGCQEYIRRCYKGGVWKGHTHCSYYRKEIGMDEESAEGQS